jgi:hypothetical protein
MAGGMSLPRGIFRLEQEAMDRLQIKIKHFAHVKAFV